MKRKKNLETSKLHYLALIQSSKDFQYSMRIYIYIIIDLKNSVTITNIIIFETTIIKVVKSFDCT
jgi:hypothetical protein